MPPKKGGKGNDKKSGEKDIKASEVWDALISSSKSAGKQLGFAGDNHIANMFEEQAEERKDDFPTQVIVAIRCEPLLIKVLMKALVAVNYEGLKQLRFWNCGFGDLGMKFIAEGLKQLPGVKHLEVSDCLVGPKGCEYLSGVLQNITQAKLKTLRLDHNNIGNVGAAFLSRGLSFNSCLETLSLKYCDITKDGASSLGNLMKVKHLAIKNLSLEGNALGNAGIIEFCKGLSENRSLNEIDLSSCEFSEPDEGEDMRGSVVVPLSQAFRTTPQLTYINIDGNLIGDKGLTIMLDLLADVKHIQFIDVTPLLSPDVLALLHEYLAKNKPAPAKKGGKKKGKKK